ASPELPPVSHQYAPVGEADGEGATRAALAHDGSDDRRPQPGHLEQIAGDRFGLPALSRTEPRIAARRIDQRDDRRAELLREAHKPERFAVSLGVRHAKVAPQI